MFHYMLAPMEDITGPAFRKISHKYGADMVFTEMARVDALARKNKSTLSKIELRDDTPTQIQLLGSKEESFSNFLQDFSPNKGFAGFSLNLSCPSPRVLKIGQGAAMIRRISKVKRIVSIFRDHSYPISIKTRLGINRPDRAKKPYLNLIQEVDADFFIVHARLASDTYRNQPDFSVYDACTKTGKSIIANGDIKKTAQVKKLQESGISGAMIGRAAAADPAIFARLKRMPAPASVVSEICELSSRYKEPDKYRNNLLKWPR